MREVQLTGVDGVRWEPNEPSHVGALVVAGSSGRVDTARAREFAKLGVLAESVRWFGGPDQHDGPWEIPLEFFLERVDGLAEQCDRIVVVGTSFGAEAALLVGSLHPAVDTVIAFAPSDVVWGGAHPDDRLTSHWTFGGAVMPYVPFDEDWHPVTDPPAFVGLYESSRQKFPARLNAAAIPVEKIENVLLVAGGDDEVWPSVDMAHAIVARRRAAGLATDLVQDPEAGHRTILPGEDVVIGGMWMRRGGTEEADRRLGASAWEAIQAIV